MNNPVDQPKVSELLTAIEELRLHVHDDTTFAMPDLENLLAEIDALTPQATTVGVKALEWKDEPGRDDEFPGWLAETVFGKEYRVFKAWWGKENTWAYVGDSGFYHTPEEAKGAAQADYDTRVRSALIGIPGAENDALITTRWEEAGFVEFINEDVPTIVRDLDGPAAVLLDMTTRKVVGYRVYDSAPAPTSERVQALEDALRPFADVLDEGEGVDGVVLTFTAPDGHQVVTALPGDAFAAAHAALNHKSS